MCRCDDGRVVETESEYRKYSILNNYRPVFQKFHQRGVNGMFSENLPVSHHKQLLACTRKRHVQLAIHRAVVVEVAQKIQLIRFIDAERNDNYIALTSLKTLYRIYHHIFVIRNIRFCEFVFDKRDLVAVWCDDSDISSVEITSVVYINFFDGFYDFRYDIGFIIIGFRRDALRSGLFRREKSDSVFRYISQKNIIGIGKR